MSGGFRGSDEVLQQEIATLEAIARLRVRRYGQELRELERDLHELKAERARRKARTRGVDVSAGVAASDGSARA